MDKSLKILQGIELHQMYTLPSRQAFGILAADKGVDFDAKRFDPEGRNISVRALIGELCGDMKLQYKYRTKKYKNRNVIKFFSNNVATKEIFQVEWCKVQNETSTEYVSLSRNQV